MTIERNDKTKNINMLHFYKINAHEFYFKMSTKKYIEYFSEKLIKLNNLIGGFSNINDLFIL